MAQITFLLGLVGLLGCNTSQPTTPTQPAQTSQAAPSAASPRTRSNRARADAAPGAFDLYLLNLSWSPEYCHSHPSAAECAAHDTFVLHGLWPENADGTYPSACSSAPGPANPAQYADLYPDPGLLQHEWQTHGTCSGLAPDAYFNAVRAAYKSVNIPVAFASLSQQTSLPPAQIQADFHQSNPKLVPQDTLVSCGSNYLTAVEACLDKSTLAPVACPSALHSCGATSVRIPAPQ